MKKPTQGQQEIGPGTTSGAQPSQSTKETVQGTYARGKRKYDTEDPDITLTWDDAELVADKVQDRSEEAVKTTEAQREQIMAKLIEVHVNIQQLWDHAESQATAQQQKAVPRPPMRRSNMKRWYNLSPRAVTHLPSCVK
jgi:hypothetical protein